jgi:hypothetical protein
MGEPRGRRLFDHLDLLHAKIKHRHKGVAVIRLTSQMTSEVCAAVAGELIVVDRVASWCLFQKVPGRVKDGWKVRKGMLRRR